MWISNQDSIGGGNVQYVWKPRRRRLLLSSWVNVSMIRTNRILPNKTRINCWLATIRFCIESKQPRRAIKTYRGSILLCDQSLTWNDLKGNALSNLVNYSDWSTFVVTQSYNLHVSSANAIGKTKNSLLQNFQFFLRIPNQIFRCGANRAKDLGTSWCHDKLEILKSLDEMRGLT